MGIARELLLIETRWYFAPPLTNGHTFNMSTKKSAGTAITEDSVDFL